MLNMLNFIKSSRRFVSYSFLMNSRKNFLTTARPFTCSEIRLYNSSLKLVTAKEMIISRQKSSRRKKTYERAHDDDEEEEKEENESDEDKVLFKGDQVKTYETQAARIDKILKTCLRISRKDIEDMFYQTKVRVNGKILRKKSINANVGDEIDVIEGFVNDNSKLIKVNRIEILNIKDDPENLKYKVKIKNSKSLIIENYSESDEWKG